MANSSLSTTPKALDDERVLMAAIPCLGWRFTLEGSSPWIARRIGPDGGTVRIETKRDDDGGVLLGWLFSEFIRVEDEIARQYAGVLITSRRFTNRMPGFRHSRSPAIRSQLDQRAQALEELAWEAGTALISLQIAAERLAVDLPSYVSSEWLSAGVEAVHNGDQKCTFRVRDYLS